MNYTDYLQSEHWQDTRERKLSEVSCCEKCGKSKGLEVHHLTYERVGNEQMSDLRVLCATCHRRSHGRVPEPKDFKRTGGGTLYGWETKGYKNE